MNRDRTIVRASDIGLWTTCHRAWWLARVQNAPHRNPALLEQGTAAHAAHGAAVGQARALRQAALLLLAAAAVVVLILLFLAVMH